MRRVVTDALVAICASVSGIMYQLGCPFRDLLRIRAVRFTRSTWSQVSNAPLARTPVAIMDRVMLLGVV